MSIQTLRCPDKLRMSPGIGPGKVLEFFWADGVQTLFMVLLWKKENNYRQLDMVTFSMALCVNTMLTVHMSSY